MPTTRKELCAYINYNLEKLREEARYVIGKDASISFVIKGNTFLIHDYITDMCDTYNYKNEMWKCSVEMHNSNADEFILYIQHIFADNDRFSWQEEYDDGLLTFKKASGA